MGFKGGVGFGSLYVDSVTIGKTGNTISVKDDAITLPKMNNEANFIAPIGSIFPWLKSFTNTPTLPAGWVECDGSVLSDADSVFDGETLPDLNGNNNFLRGSATSGSSGGSDTHHHKMGLGGTSQLSWNEGHIYGTDGTLTSSRDVADTGSGTTYDGNRKTSTSSNLPAYYEIVYIMRVK